MRAVDDSFKKKDAAAAAAAGRAGAGSQPRPQRKTAAIYSNQLMYLAYLAPDDEARFRRTPNLGQRAVLELLPVCLPAIAAFLRVRAAAPGVLRPWSVNAGLDRAVADDEVMLVEEHASPAPRWPAAAAAAASYSTAGAGAGAGGHAAAGDDGIDDAALACFSLPQ